MKGLLTAQLFSLFFSQGKDVIISQDGWSNIHREPIIATCIHVPGKSFLHDAVDVGDVTKDAEYCAELAKESILSAEARYGCRVVGFVSDNEAKMVKVRKILQVGIISIRLFFSSDEQ